MKPNVKQIEEYMAELNYIESKNNTKGVKFDDSKLRWSLIPLDALQDVVKVLEFGAKKYAPDNWKYVDKAQERYWDAAMRHIVAYKLDNKADSETGLSHLAHAICCLLFLLNFDNQENNK